ncbi:thioredoxin domain-containing protein [Mesorhizobium sp. UC22_110]|uniref:thioredoxin domain-containing protein n=1 Tax=unclassified Mesorhizobium TaxID=325217 RepID=UPI003672FAE8
MKFLSTATVISALLLSDGAAFASPKSALNGVLMQPAGVEDTFIGSKQAPATLIVYSSPTCGHCVDFEKKVLPDLERKYVQTGKLRISIRPFARNAVDAAIFLIAEQAGQERHRKTLAAFTDRYEEIIAATERKGVMSEIAASQGIDQLHFEQALKNEAYLRKLEGLRDQAMQQLEIKGTPTFFLNGERLVYDGTVTSFDKVLTSR